MKLIIRKGIFQKMTSGREQAPPVPPNCHVGLEEQAMPVPYNFKWKMEQTEIPFHKVEMVVSVYVKKIKN